MYYLKSFLLTAIAVLFCGNVWGALTSNTSSNSTSNLATIIANHGQITNLPTIYIDIFDAEEDTDKDPLEYVDASQNTYYKIKDTNGSLFEISNSIIESNPSTATSNAKSLDIRTETKAEEYELARIRVVDNNEDLSIALKNRDELTYIRGRGNSTWNTGKKAYRLKFPSKTALLRTMDDNNNYADVKNWTLLANASDVTLLRNAMAHETGKFIGLPFCPAAVFVDLVYNNEYVGTYQISDQVKVEKNNARIPVDNKTGWFAELTINKFKEDPCFATLNNNGGSSGIYAVIKNPEVTDDNIEDVTFDPIKEWLNGMTSCLSNYSLDLTSNGYKKYIDIESLIDYYIGVEITGNYDAWISNYVYKEADETDKLHWGPMWDYDLAFGNYQDLAETMTYDINNSNGSYLNSMIKKILEQDASFVGKLNERWTELEDKTLDGKKGIYNYLTAKLDEYVNHIKQSRILNFTKTPNGAGWSLSENALSGVSTNQTGNYDTDITNLKSFIKKHTEKITSQFSTLLSNLHSDQTLYLDATTYYFSTWAVNGSNLAGKILNASLTNGSYTANSWNPMCLPFNLDATQITTIFGSNTEIAEYTSLDSDGTMVFNKVTSITAGVPFLIKPTSTLSSTISFENVIPITGTAQTVKINDSDEYSFVGTFTQNNNMATNGTIGLFDSKSNCFITPTSGSLLGFKAYISKPSSNSSVSIRFNTDNEGIATNIRQVENNNADNTIYNLNGQRINKVTGKGVYIINGKKVVMK